ncbi:MAG: response regulator transcription factor [Hyphomicrobiales bacterium]|nr:response regulator transcription factor [Hyphomicrobiales bacterium]
MNKILVVDDDPHIVDVIGFALEKTGHQFTSAKDGAEAIKAFHTQSPDLIILDVGLPEMDGLEVCRQLRKTSEVPILFLSARDEEIDRILGLEIGGDDYVTKPFSPRELVARIGVILKRTNNAASFPPTDTMQLGKGELSLDAEHHSAKFGTYTLSLTALEFAILQTLLSRPRMAFSREQILNVAYPDNLHVSDRTIDSHIRNIRAKLKEVGCDNVVETVHGIGFRLGNCNAS